MDPLYDALLGQLAVDAGLLTQTQLAECIRLRESTGRPLGAILLEKGYLTDESLEKLLEARAEASYLGLFPLDVRKKSTTEMFAAPVAAAPAPTAAPAPSGEIADAPPVFPGEGAPAGTPPGEVEVEFISDTPLPEEPEEGVPVAAFADPSRDIPAPIDHSVRPPTAAELPDVSGDERSFGMLLVHCGLLNERRIEECLEAQNAIRTHGIRLRLGEILVRKGIASPKQIRDILRLQGVTLLHCPECLVNYNVHGYGQGKPASCPRCEHALVVPVVTAIDAVDTMVLGPQEAGPRAPIEKFGRYQLFEEIGHGQLGITYKAWDTQAGRLVALKRLCPVDAAVGEDLDRITEDAKPAVGYRHPAAAEVYEVSDVDGDRYVASEYVEGTALSKHLREGDTSIDPPIPLTPRNIADIARQVAGALGAAHAKDILHHDVRPSNIFLDPDGRPHLTDFGLAIDQRPSLGDSPSKFSHPIRGTFPYIAPECALEDAPVGPGADVFSLGVVMYEALTGKVPFEGDSPEKVLYSILTSVPEPPSKWALNLPHDLEQIVMKAIARDPAERYGDGTALAVDLHRFVSGEALEEAVAPGEPPLAAEQPTEVEPAAEVEPVAALPTPRPARRDADTAPLTERIAARKRAQAEQEPAASGGGGKLVLVLVFLALIGGGYWAWQFPVTNYLKKKKADEEFARQNWKEALKEYKFLEERKVEGARDKAAECQRKIDAQQKAVDAANRKIEAQAALEKARETLEGARGALRTAITAGPESSAKAQDGMTKAAAAAEQAMNATAKDPELLDAWVVLAQARWMTGDADGARQAAEKVPSGRAQRAGVAPTLVSISLRGFLSLRGPLAEAVVPAAGVPSFARPLPEPTDEEFRKAQSELKAFRDELGEPSVLTQPLSKGVTALLEGKAAAAAKELEDVVKAAPEDAAVREALAVALLSAGQPDAALSNSEAALVLRPSDALAMWAKASALAAQGKPDAEALLDKAIAADPRLAFARLDRIAAKVAAGKADQAVGDAMQAVSDHPGDARALVLLSRVHRAAGDLPSALSDAEKALSINAGCGAALVQHGDLLRRAGRLDEAVQELKRCVVEAPEDLEAGLWLAEALVAKKDSATALAVLDKVMSVAVGWPEALATRAEAKLLNKDAEGAFLDADSALSKDPGQSAALRVRALARLAKGEGATVERDLSQAIDKFPKDPDLITARARLRMKTGQWKEAIVDLTVALSLSPTDASLLLDRARAYRRTGAVPEALRDLEAATRSGQASLDVLLERARLKEETGDLPGALSDATEAMKTGPDSAAARAIRARVLAASGQAADATQDANQAVTLDPSSAEALHARALVREALGQLDDAKKDLDQAIAIDATVEAYYPFRARLRRLTGDAQGAAEDEARAAKAFRPEAQKLLDDARHKADGGDLPNAAALAERALRIDPGNVAAWRDRGFYRLKGNDAQGALSDLDRAHDLDPKNADVLSQRASVKRSLKDLQGAVDDWSGCLDIDPARADDRVARATAYRTLGQRDKALDEVNQALAQKPDSADGRRLRAALRNALREYAGAIEDAGAAIAAGGADGWTFYQRGYAYDALGKLQEAADDFTRAISANENYADAYSHRGWVNLEMGNAAKARDDEAQALKISPANIWAHFRLAAVYASESAQGAQSPIASDGDLAARAIEELTKAIDGGYTSRSFLEGTKYFDPIRNDPRYQELLPKLK